MAIRNPTLDALLPRGIRNFNPGNIEDKNFARSQPGYVGGDGRFARFDTIDHGIDAQSALLAGYGKKGLNTLNAIVNRWAPKGDGANDPAAYAAFVGKQIGIDPNSPIDMNDPAIRKNIALAMGRYENGGDVMSLASKVQPTDARAFAAIEEASGPNVPFPGSPSTPAMIQEQTLVPGSQQQQGTYSGVGPALANIGSIVAGLDRHGPRGLVAGLANTADNLVAQQRLNQNKGLRVLDTSDKGMITQDPNTGEIKMMPLPAGYSNSEQTAMEKDLAAVERNPKLKEAYDAKYGLTKLEPSLSPDTRRMYAMRAIKGDNSWTREIGGDKQGNVDKRAIDEEITTVARELDLKPDDIMKARTEQRYRSKVADRIALIDVNTQTAANKIDAAATNLIETSKKYPRGDIRFLEGIKQKWDEQTNDPNLQALKTAVDAFALDYATALNPQKTSPTVDDVRNARNKILTTMNQESLEAAVGIVQREIGSIRENARRTHEQWFGSSDSSPEIGNKTIRNSGETSSQSAPSIDKEKALEELRRRGKI